MPNVRHLGTHTIIQTQMVSFDISKSIKLTSDSPHRLVRYVLYETGNAGWICHLLDRHKFLTCPTDAYMSMVEIWYNMPVYSQPTEFKKRIYLRIEQIVTDLSNCHCVTYDELCYYPKSRLILLHICDKKLLPSPNLPDWKNKLVIKVGTPWILPPYLILI